MRKVIVFSLASPFQGQKRNVRTKLSLCLWQIKRIKRKTSQWWRSGSQKDIDPPAQHVKALHFGMLFCQICFISFTFMWDSTFLWMSNYLPIFWWLHLDILCIFVYFCSCACKKIRTVQLIVHDFLKWYTTTIVLVSQGSYNKLVQTWYLRLIEIYSYPSWDQGTGQNFLKRLCVRLLHCLFNIWCQ